jgi:hypothetical protein
MMNNNKLRNLLQNNTLRSLLFLNVWQNAEIAIDYFLIFCECFGQIQG